MLGLGSYAERVQYTAEKILTVCPELQIEDLKTAFDLYYKKLLISLKYTPKYKLQRDISLIKASESVDMSKNFSDVYDLEKVSIKYILSYLA